MSDFDRLHPALQHHIVNSLGWPGLRPLQQATIAPVIDGQHAILLAPTAGGKTEAAMFPLFSRLLSEQWQGLSILYVCPIKALLNNLEPRLQYYAGLLGYEAAVWHGDVNASRKKKLLAQPPAILLTTPESLEGMLVSSAVEHQQFLGNVRAVVIDEVHAFAGDDRGWHLLYLLERLSHLTGREIQRLGLSATVGNPDELCDWLAAGCSQPRSILNPVAEQGQAPDVQLDWVANLRNAALVISRLHRGEKRLVFCDSRARVEELAILLRSLEVVTYVSHSCLSLEERTSAEQAFSEGQNCVIVATSTLELGIDVGDLDRVIQIDAPSTVSSFLQRIGRTGRRTGSSRNCLFLVTRSDAFLPALALLHLWRSGFVEPVVAPPLPLHLFAQQVMATVLQQRGMPVDDWRLWLGRLPGLESVEQEQLQALVQHMLSTGILHSDQGIIGIGLQGEKQFGARYFLDLLSVFISPPLVKVLHGKQEIGEVHQNTFLVKEEGPAVLTLAGRAWQTAYIDWRRRVAYVEPTTSRGRSQWLSAGRAMPFSLCQAIPAILAGETDPQGLSNRALELLVELREQYEWVSEEYTSLIDSGDGFFWWNFAGKHTNAALAHALKGVTADVTFDDFCLQFSTEIALQQLQKAIADLSSIPSEEFHVPLDENFVVELKFSECLSQESLDEVLRARYHVTDSVAIVLSKPVVATVSRSS